MKKLAKALKSANKFGLAAIVIAAIFTLSFKVPQNKRADMVWVQTSENVWQKLEGREYQCNLSDHICSASFPENQDPNQDDSGGTVISENGYATIVE